MHFRTFQCYAPYRLSIGRMKQLASSWQPDQTKKLSEAWHQPRLKQNVIRNPSFLCRGCGGWAANKNWHNCVMAMNPWANQMKQEHAMPVPVMLGTIHDHSCITWCYWFKTHFHQLHSRLPETTLHRHKIQVLAGPDMSDFRLLVQFDTFQVQKWYFDEMT